MTWESRSAVINDERGKAVFEQKDVEVPEFWSQLATNVVVSKYFRGHIGTPSRERSVKQLIDRVVNTITSWAATQRYFATDDDLATFKAELTHLLRALGEYANMDRAHVCRFDEDGDTLVDVGKEDRKSGSAGMPRPERYRVCRLLLEKMISGRAYSS